MAASPDVSPEQARDPLDQETSITSVVTVMARPVARPSPLAPPLPPAAASPSTATGDNSISVASPLDALVHAEVLRTRNFARLSLPIAVAGIIAILCLPGEPIPTLLMLTATIVAAASLAYFLYRTRDLSSNKLDFDLTLAWYVSTLAVCSSVPFFGPYTPVPAVLVFGIYITSMGQRLGVSLAMYLTCAVVQGVTGSLAIFGIADPGFVKGAWLSVEIRIVCQGLVQVLLLGSFLSARASRRSSLIALGELERAVRSAAQRQALLDEAREELRRALGAGRGRFTGQQIGRYRLGDIIGRGGTGEVYESVDPAGTRVAVKMLAHAALSNPQHVQRFLRELRTAAAIDSPHVVRVFEVGEEPLPYLAMERLDGRDLAGVLRESRVLPLERVVDLVQQVGAGLAAADAAGIIHRDIKPQNLMLAGTTWKILDFGVARLADSGDTLTAGHIIGTPAYMAPEQASGDTVTHRTDLYALVATAYRAVTGHAVHGSGDSAEVLYRVVHQKPRRPGSLVSLPREMDLVFAIGLAKAPADRFASAAELAAAFAAAASSSLDESTRAHGRQLIARGAWARDPTVPPPT